MGLGWFCEVGRYEVDIVVMVLDMIEELGGLGLGGWEEDKELLSWWCEKGMGLFGGVWSELWSW